MRESSSLLLGQELDEFLADQAKIRRRVQLRRPVESANQLAVRTLEVLVGTSCKRWLTPLRGRAGRSKSWLSQS